MEGKRKPNEGRLQTSEHILGKIIENKVSDALIGICKFGEDSGILEISTKTDLREIDIESLQDEVNTEIAKNLDVRKKVKSREEAEKEVNLRKVPICVAQITIVEIGEFDKRPCRDPHVENTSEIGKFEILSVKRVGSDRYRYTFKVI